MSIVHALEFIGQQCVPEIKNGLGHYEQALTSLALSSPFAVDVPSVQSGYHTPFSELFRSLVQARNDVVHQGTYARAVTDHAVDVSLVLADALMAQGSTVSQFMVRNVVEVKQWHPISHVRQLMLKHAFSYLPFLSNDRWRLVPEHAVARYLRSAKNKEERRKRLILPLSEIREEDMPLLDAVCVKLDTSIPEILAMIRDHPLLVVDPNRGDTLIGLISASDIL